MNIRLAIALIALPLLAACETHSYRTDETGSADGLVGECFALRTRYRVYPRPLAQDQRPNARDVLPDSFSYDGHFVVWSNASDYGIAVPAGSRFVVEAVLATHYPYPKNVTIYTPYVRLDDANASLLVAANAVFTGPNGYLPQPNPMYLSDCD